MQARVEVDGKVVAHLKLVLVTTEVRGKHLNRDDLSAVQRSALQCQKGGNAVIVAHPRAVHLFVGNAARWPRMSFVTCREGVSGIVAVQCMLA